MNTTVNELQYLGKEVEVTVDRPIHSQHPEFKFTYPLNYGFIANTTGGDGEPIDAYVFGEIDQLKTFKGVVKAVIIRKNDTENKLVVTHQSYSLNEQEIRFATHFQEKYFDIEIKLC